MPRVHVEEVVCVLRWIMHVLCVVCERNRELSAIACDSVRERRTKVSIHTWKDVVERADTCIELAVTRACPGGREGGPTKRRLEQVGEE